MLYEFVLANHELIVVAAVVFIAYIVGIYIKTLVEKKFTAPKPGTRRGCEDCLAMQAISERLPKLEARQDECQRASFPEIIENITILKADVDNMQQNISKLFNLIEQSWLAQINRLETALHRSVLVPIQDMPELVRRQETGDRKNDKGKKGSSGAATGSVQKSKSRGKKGVG